MFVRHVHIRKLTSREKLKTTKNEICQEAVEPIALRDEIGAAVSFHFTGKNLPR